MSNNMFERGKITPSIDELLDLSGDELDETLYSLSKPSLKVVALKLLTTLQDEKPYSEYLRKENRELKDKINQIRAYLGEG
ncbi:hypothetical protein BH753_gp027 [Bacillus phage Shbh1]|uniref:Uncharacterized protein n=1 Tax=Bacillus phage Shbh1 TaxID=1796992 RepID=A0A142F152_9CAUD|nr:hypothetical protein BH753_gp027 [Bacillus phage Shbh1]AMQ66509.1 hypothetical protein [Bacillus phage Shbh1]